ncbi:MAG: Ig-like domain-containing protein [Candidatus Thorarchaeota archaeon]
MLMQKKMGLVVASVTLILTVMTFAPYLVPVAVTSDGTTPSGTTPDATLPDIAPPGTLAYWKLNENSGSDAHDSVVPYIDGLIAGGSRWVPGVSESGLELLSNQYIGFGTDTRLYALNSLTVEAWVNLEDISGLHTIIMNAHDSVYIMYHFGIQDGHLYFHRQSTLPEHAYTSTATIRAGEWHHVAVVMFNGGSRLAFYIDGTEEFVNTNLDGYRGPAGLSTIGADRVTGTPSFFEGKIDEILVLDSILDHIDILRHYQKGLLGLGYFDDIPTNVAPVANDDSYTMDQDTILPIGAPGVLGNDVDSDGDSLETDLVSGPSNGGLVLNPDGSLVYTPASGFVGIDAFEYRAYDGTDYSDPATVTITVEAVNHAPVAIDDAYTGTEDMVMAHDTLLSNDFDNDGDSLEVIFVSGPSNGILDLYSDGSFIYYPDLNWFGVDSFTYQVSDGQEYSNVATVEITIESVNDVPVATDDDYSGVEDTELTGSSILSNDSDGDEDYLEINLVSGTSHGVLTLNLATGSFTYLPDSDWSGTDKFTYELYDGQIYSNVATVTITIAGENDVPVASDESFTGDEDSDLHGTLAAIDADGDPLTFESVSGTSNGVLTFSPDGTFTYSPEADWFGPDSFTFRVYDGQAYSNVATITITITGVNDLPVAGDDEFTGDEDTALVGSVLDNDNDVEWDIQEVHVVSGPSHGILDLNVDTGVFTYLPDANRFGTDSFTYYVFDGHVFSNVATVTLTIVSVNDAPIAYDELYSGYEDIDLNGILPLATDIEGDPITYEPVSGPRYGILIFNPDGTFTYSPEADWFEIDTFTYRVFDGTDYSNIATVTIEIIEEDDITGPEITIIYSGGFTDGNPGTWTVSVIDPESGVDWISVEIDGVIVDTVEGIYAVPSSLGEHTITVTAANADLDYGPADQETSTLTDSVTIIDDDTTGPAISIVYSGDATDGNPGTWTVTVTDPESGIDWISVEIDGVFVGTVAGTYTVPNSVGLHTIRVNATNADIDFGPADQEFSMLSHTVTIVDDDVTAPSISIIYTGDQTDVNPGFWTVAVSDVESGIFSILVEVDGVAAGTLEGDYAVPSSVGPHTITVTALNNDLDRPSDQESNTETDTIEIIQTTQPTEIVYTGDESGVYSDPVYLEALLLDTIDQLPIPGKTVMFTLGTQTAYAVTDEDGVASVFIILDQEAGVYELSVLFVEDDDYLGSSSTSEFVIYRECALVIYSGVTLVEVSEESIILRATVFDDADGYWGDLTHIYVTFTFYLSSNPLTPVHTTYPVRVQTTGTAGIGLATLEMPILPEGDYFLVVSLLPEHNGYYCAPDSQAVSITVYEPERAFVKGVGMIKDADGHHGFFAFRIWYSCKGTLNGFFAYSYRDGDSIYFMKSCDILGFATDDNHGFFEANGTISRFNFKTFEFECSDERYRFRVDVFDNKKSHEKDVFQFRVFDGLGLVEFEIGFDPFGYLKRGCIVVKHYKRH